MKSLILTFLLVVFIPLGSHAGSPVTEDSPSSIGFEKDARSAHTSKVLLAKLSKNAQLHLSGVSFVVCQYAGANKAVCSRLFKLSDDGFIEEVNPVAKEDIIKILTLSELDFDANLREGNSMIHISFEGKAAKVMYNKLTKVYTDYDEGPGYTKESRSGTNIKCFSIQTDGLKKYTCKLSLVRE